MKNALTILTNSIPPEKHRFLKVIRFLKRLLLGRRPLIDSYEGHPAVTRSVLKGLEKLRFPYNYNPSNPIDAASTVVVLNDLNALRQAIDLKKRGGIQKLFGGPILIIDPSDEKSLLSSPEIDGIIVPSNWVRDFYINEIPQLAEKCQVWPAGVDTREWKPDPAIQKRKRALIYDKLDHGEPLEEYRKHLTKWGWETSLIRYGHYNKKQFLSELQQSQIAIFFSSSESQGIALQESWAADVPTLVWDRKWISLNNKRIPSSSAPYLNFHVGLAFKDLNSFQEIIENWENTGSSFNPRKWVCENLSDEICADNLLKLVGLQYD